MPCVLIIDDDPALRTMLRRTLEASGYEAAEAEDGDAGLTHLRRQTFDVLITDIYMPGKEGVETILQVRREFPRLPILAMSGGTSRGDTGILATVTGFGVRQVFTKPLDVEALLAAVREIAPSEP